jgi:hypothetical protein
VAHTRSVSSVVAEFCCATLNVSGIPLRYAALTTTVSVAAICWESHTSVRLSDKVFIVLPHKLLDEHSEFQGPLGSEGIFQWTVYEITNADHQLRRLKNFIMVAKN